MRNNRCQINGCQQRKCGPIPMVSCEQAVSKSYIPVQRLMLKKKENTKNLVFIQNEILLGNRTFQKVLKNYLKSPVNSYKIIHVQNGYVSTTQHFIFP